MTPEQILQGIAEALGPEFRIHRRMNFEAGHDHTDSADIAGPDFGGQIDLHPVVHMDSPTRAVLTFDPRHINYAAGARVVRAIQRMAVELGEIVVVDA